MAVELCETRTKRELDHALRQLLERKPLDQIRVREVTELCAIRRQSFYYHFPDVYALFAWSLRREREQLIARQSGCLVWQQALKDLLRHTAQHRAYYQALLKSRGRTGLREVLGEPLGLLLQKTAEYYWQRCGVAGEDLPGQVSYRETMLLVLMESWIQNDLPQEAEHIVELLEKDAQRSVLGFAWEHVSQQIQ